MASIGHSSIFNFFFQSGINNNKLYKSQKTANIFHFVRYKLHSFNVVVIVAFVVVVVVLHQARAIIKCKHLLQFQLSESYCTAICKKCDK